MKKYKRKMAMTDEQIEIFIRTNAGKLTLLEMQVETNVSMSYIQKIATRLNISLSKHHRQVNHEKIKQAILDNKDKCASDVARIVGVKPSTIFYHAKLIGVTLPKKSGGCRLERTVTHGKFFNCPPGFNWLLGMFENDLRYQY